MRIYFTINNIGCSIEDLDNSELNIEFINFYNTYFNTEREKLIGIIENNLEKIFRKAETFFQNKISDSHYHDGFFNNFTIFTNDSLAKGFYEHAHYVWHRVYNWINNFEKAHNTSLHKGSLYYWWGEVNLAQKNIDLAIINFVNAVEQDRIIDNVNYKSNPAYKFLALDDTIFNHYLIKQVVYYTNFIKKRLNGNNAKYKGHYANLRSGSLTYNDFRNKFYNNNAISDEVKFIFTSVILKLYNLRIIQKNYKSYQDNIVFSNIILNNLSNLILVWEQSLNLSSQVKSDDTLTPKVNDFFQLSTKITKQETKTEREANFNNWLNKYLSANDVKSDMIIAIGLRNHSFHNIQSKTAVINDYTKIFQSIMNCIFYTLEKI